MTPTAKRGLEILIVVVVLATLALALLPALQMDYIPTADQVSSHPHVALFFVQKKFVEGIYGNHDIDVIVFRYVTSSRNAADFEAKVAQQAVAAGWSPLPSEMHCWRFERITPKGNNMFCGAEEVRVRLSPNWGFWHNASKRGNSSDELRLGFAVALSCQ